MALVLDFGDKNKLSWKPTNPEWQKWLPSNPTSAHWYREEDLRGLIAAYISDGQGDRTVREFVSEFAGLSSALKQKRVVERAKLQRCPLADLASKGKLDTSRISALLKAMQDETKPIKPEKLGVIGEDNFRSRFAIMGGDAGTFRYKKLAGITEGLPYVIEVAFAMHNDSETQFIVGGVNWSPAVKGVPFDELGNYRTLDGLLQECYCGEQWNRVEPVIVAIHLVTPNVGTSQVAWKDRGKSILSLDGEMADQMEKAVRFVTKHWVKQRRSEEREASRALRREEALDAEKAKSNEMSLKDAVFLEMENAVHEATGGGRYNSVSGRNLYYSIRELIQKHTSKELRQSTFDHIMKKQWEPEHGIIEEVYRDPRGYLVEPHTGKTIPLGTRQVEQYEIPKWLYHTVLYVEKKGMAPLFQEAKIAEKYDLAIISAEGYASDAAKVLMSRADKLDMTILCLHDADPAGKHIHHKLQHATLRNPRIKVIDIGMDLAEALEMGLATETFIRKKKLPQDLELTDLEREFWEGEFCGYHKGKKKYKCRRIELNAMAANPDRFIAYVEQKLREHGLDKKVVPPDEVIDKRAERKIKDGITEHVLDDIGSMLDTGSIVSRIVKEFEKQVDVDDVPDGVEEWAGELKPKSWTTFVDDEVYDLVNEHDDTIRKMVRAELIKQAAEIEDDDEDDDVV